MLLIEQAETAEQLWASDHTKFISLSKYIFVELSQDFFHKYKKVKYMGGKMALGFMIVVKGEYWLIFSQMGAYRIEIEFDDFKEGNRLRFLHWYLIWKNYTHPENGIKDLNWEDYKDKSAQEYLTDMWNNILALLDAYCQDLLSGERERIILFNKDYARCYEKMRQGLATLGFKMNSWEE